MFFFLFFSEHAPRIFDATLPSSQRRLHKDKKRGKKTNRQKPRTQRTNACIRKRHPARQPRTLSQERRLARGMLEHSYGGNRSRKPEKPVATHYKPSSRTHWRSCAGSLAEWPASKILELRSFQVSHQTKTTSVSNPLCSSFLIALRLLVHQASSPSSRPGCRRWWLHARSTRA
jgi:hypothetical protein